MPDPAPSERERARLLLDVLLGDPVRTERAAARLDACDGWPDALRLAAAWNVVPAFHDRLRVRREPGEGCKAAASAARACVATSTLRSTVALRRTADVQAELAHARVPSVAIAGVAVIATLYGAAARRTLSGIDLVIRGDDVAAAGDALERAGYEDAAGTGHDFARTFVRDDFDIALHRRFGPNPPAGLAAERILERAYRVRIDGHTLVVAGPLETALVVVHHALRGGFAAAGTVEALVDLAAWWRRSGPDERASIVGAAERSELGSSLVALSRALADRDETFAGSPAIATLEDRLGDAGGVEARRLRRFLEDSLGGDAPDGETIALFAPAVSPRSRTLELLGRVRRGSRIADELGHVRRAGRYRAVARAQSRFR